MFGSRYKFALLLQPLDQWTAVWWSGTSNPTCDHTDLWDTRL